MDKAFTVTFNADGWEAIQSLCREVDKSVSDLLRDSLSLYKFIHEARLDGGEVLIKHGDDYKQLTGI